MAKKSNVVWKLSIYVPPYRPATMEVIFSISYRLRKLTRNLWTYPMSPLFPSFCMTTIRSLTLNPLIECGELNSSPIKLLLQIATCGERNYQDRWQVSLENIKSINIMLFRHSRVPISTGWELLWIEVEA